MYDSDLTLEFVTNKSVKYKHYFCQFIHTYFSEHDHNSTMSYVFEKMCLLYVANAYDVRFCDIGGFN